MSSLLERLRQKETIQVGDEQFSFRSPGLLTLHKVEREFLDYMGMTFDEVSEDESLQAIRWGLIAVVACFRQLDDYAGITFDDANLLATEIPEDEKMKLYKLTYPALMRVAPKPESDEPEKAKKK